MILRYMDTSLRRTAPLLGFAGVLLLIVFLTFNWKLSVYGETPFFRAASLYVQEMTITAFFAARHLASGQFAAAALFPNSRTEGAEAAREARSIPVLTYHRINMNDDGTANVPFEHFMDQMETLHREGWRTITLDEYERYMRGEITLPEKSFMITFDDGAQQSFYPTDPIFRVLGYNAVQYLIVAGTQVRRSIYYLSPEQVQRMLQTGRWEIGSHSFDAHHPYSSGPSEEHPGAFYSDRLWVTEEGRLETAEEFRERVRHDLLASKEHFEREYDTPVTSFAIPFGGDAGFENANNFPEGEEITIEEAGRAYDTVWIQTERKEYTQNFPGIPLKGYSFLHQRIHVDHDWNGQELLAIMENGLPKDLPFYDDMRVNRGWLRSWGQVEAGTILQLASSPNESSVSALLDGTRLWHTYAVSMTVDWNGGSVFLLGNAEGQRTYRSCAFSAGGVQVQDTRDGEARVIARARDTGIRYGSDIRLGMRVNESSIDCLYEGRIVLRASSLASREGGIGVQVWHPTLGQAFLTVKEVAVEPL